MDTKTPVMGKTVNDWMELSEVDFEKSISLFTYDGMAELSLELSSAYTYLSMILMAATNEYQTLTLTAEQKQEMKTYREDVAAMLLRMERKVAILKKHMGAVS